jgi:hypothetical protein
MSSRREFMRSVGKLYTFSGEAMKSFAYVLDFFRFGKAGTHIAFCARGFCAWQQAKGNVKLFTHHRYAGLDMLFSTRKFPTFGHQVGGKTAVMPTLHVCPKLVSAIDARREEGYPW